MNTSDVRDMALTQWAFWVSAVSFTIMVVLITVYFVDVPPLWRWLERKGGPGLSGMPPRPASPHKGHFLASLLRQGEEMAAIDGAVLNEGEEANMLRSNRTGTAEPAPAKVEDKYS